VFFVFMRLVCLVVVFFHRQACLLGGQTTNRIFNYAADIPGSGESRRRAAGHMEHGIQKRKKEISKIKQAKFCSRSDTGG